MATINGTTAGDLLLGTSDSDAIFGRRGDDVIGGGNGDDVLTGGDGADQLFGQGGDDRIVWNAGDDSDIADGGSGIDTLEVNGNGGAEAFTVVTNGAGFRVDRVDPAPFAIGATTIEKIVINANAGNDVVNASPLQAASAQLTIDGGTGNDTLTGSQGADVLLGGNGNDVVTGGFGNDLLLLGAGNDVAIWSPGGANDTIEGQGGTDTLDFFGANVGELIDIGANGERARFFRNVANVTLDLNDVETIRYHALGGADAIAVGDLTGTDVDLVDIDLAGFVGGTLGDSAPDTVFVNGTAGAELFTLKLENGVLVIDGPAGRVMVRNFEIDNDVVHIRGLGGDDVIDASALGELAPRIVLDGGEGDDVLLGGEGSETLLGGVGDDVLLGGPGVDVLDGGEGEDIELSEAGGAAGDMLTLVGNGGNNTISVARSAAGQITANVPVPGTPTVATIGLIRVLGRDGADTITLNEANGALPAAALYGEAGNDVLTAGSSGDQLFGGGDNDTILGKGGFDLLFGGAGNDVLTGGDGDDQMFGQGGDDRIVWNPGDDTDLAEGGSGIDTLEVNGNGGAETFTVVTNGAGFVVDRLDPAPFRIFGSTIERVVINANGGNDVVNAGTLSPVSGAQLTVDGGAGDDVLTGSAGIDVLLGGDGNDLVTGGFGSDLLLLGAGNDVAIWSPGGANDTIEGQDGTDTLEFNGSNIAEIIDIAAIGERVRFFRNIANVTLDLNDVETVRFHAVGGADTITVNDLSGTDLDLVDLDLAGFVGGTLGDGAADTVFVNGTSGDDVVTLSLVDGALVIDGLASRVVVRNFEIDTDFVHIRGLGGNDVIDASVLGELAPRIVMDGGEGDDILLGGEGSETLLGGLGDDVLIGGPGVDVLDGGPGDNIVIA